MRAAKQSSLDTYEARRIALIKPSALGDIVHCLPLLRAVRRRYPDAHLSWIVNLAYAPLLEGHPDLDAVVPFDRTAFRRGVGTGTRALARFLGKLRRGHYDLVLDLQGLMRSAVMCWATGAPRRVGLASAREGARLAYTDVVEVPNPTEIHAVDRYRLVAQALGSSEPADFHVSIQPAARTRVAELLRDRPRPWMMFAVGSRWVTKRWLPEHFAELGRRAQKLVGGTIVFVGGKEDALLVQSACPGLAGPYLDLTGKTSLPELAAVLACADVMVANDTGPLHLAAALGRPVVAPYTCTKVKLTGPYGAFDQAVEARIWCQGSCLKTCDRMECMAELVPDRLWPVLERVLRR